MIGWVTIVFNDSVSVADTAVWDGDRITSTDALIHPHKPLRLRVSIVPIQCRDRAIWEFHDVIIVTKDICDLRYYHGD